MNTRVWWKEAVVYQIYPKSFCDLNGDGYGDIQGIISKLPYISSLGADAIWLTPFFKSPMKDNGYDISDYMVIDTMFGNMTDIDVLIKKANEYNIKILIDLVLNHTSSDHPWFKMAISSKDNQFRDYYIFRESEDGSPPNNWRSIFGGSAWEKIDDGSYYLHTFHKEQPDLNWENPKVRMEIYDIIKFWMRKGVDGFRVDAITFIKKPNNFAIKPADYDDGLRGIGKDTLNQAGIHEFLQEMKRETYFDESYMTVAEAPGVKIEDIKDYIGDNGDFSMIFDFSYTDLDVQENGNWYPKRQWTIKEYKEKIFISQVEHQKAGWIGLFTESHDQPRSIDKFFGDNNDILQDALKAKLLATMYFLMRGTPFIYQGQELGIRNHKFYAIDELDDISSVDQYQRALSMGATVDEAMQVVNQRSRDHSRTPMLWSNKQNAGFTEGEPWLPVNKDYKIKNAESQEEDINSVHSYYKGLIKLRKEEKNTLIYGRFEPIESTSDALIAYKRISDINEYSEIIIMSNLSDQLISINIDVSKYSLMIGNYNDEKNTVLFREQKLRPYEAVVLKNINK